MLGSKQFLIKIICMDEEPGWRGTSPGPDMVCVCVGAGGEGEMGSEEGREGEVGEFPCPRFIGEPS